jgi:hypothetical protein
MYRLVSALAISAVLASPASAGLANLAWTECLGAGGNQNRNFACNANGGSNRLVVSFVPNAPMADVVGHEVLIALQSADATTLNPWWQMFAPGSCRGSLVPAVDNVPVSTGCADFWSGSGSGGIGSYTITGNRALIRAHWTDVSPRPVDDVTEYYPLNIVIPNSKTVGEPKCAGCPTPVCIALQYVVLVGQSGDLQLVTTPSWYGSNLATWQGGAIAAPGCPPGPVIPTRESSWGQIKSLYR